MEQRGDESKQQKAKRHVCVATIHFACTVLLSVMYVDTLSLSRLSKMPMGQRKRRVDCGTPHADVAGTRDSSSRRANHIIYPYAAGARLGPSLTFYCRTLFFGLMNKRMNI